MALPRRFPLVSLALLCLSFSLSCEANGARRALVDAGPGEVFDITSYGAKADDPKNDNAQAIIQAWNAACKSTGTVKVVIPAGNFTTGEVILAGPCTASVTFQLDGTLLAIPDLTVYPNGQWFGIQHVDGLVLTGAGTFNAQGEQVWQNDGCKDKFSCDSRLPASLVVKFANNSVLDGFHMVNGMGFHMKIGESQNVTVQNFTVTAPGDSPNTDGIHVSRSQGVKVLGATIGTGDDCVSIGEGSSDVAVTNVACGPGHGISVGSLGKRPDEKDVSGVVVSGCTITGTTNGARIKSWHNTVRTQATGITFQDIIMKDVQNPIIIDQHYGSKNQGGSSNVKISDVHFKNITGTTITPEAVALHCSETVPCEGVEVADIDLALVGKPTSAGSIITSACENVQTTFLGKLTVPKCP